MNKRKLVAAIVERLREDLALYHKAATAARAEATHEQSKAENKYDTRGLEASYLAGGQSRQAAEIAQAIAAFEKLPVRDFAATDTIDTGAAIELQSGKEKVHYFIGPRAGEGTVEVAKFKFRLYLNIAREENRLVVTMDIPEQGAKGLPVAAILFNSPDVRIEVDQFQTAYNGKLSDDLNTISGEFEEGPGGRPMPVTFARYTKVDEPEPERVFTFKPGEARDIRGHWKGTIEPFPGMSLTIGLNIGRIANSTFKASMDVLEQGAKEIPASAVTTTNDTVDLKWDALQLTIKGKVSDDLNQMDAEWKQAGRPLKTSFIRLDAPASLIPKDISYDRDPNVADDIRGQWAGKLDTPGQKLRLTFNIGKTKEGKVAGFMKSLDQGGGEMPMSSAAVELPKVTMEWKGIGGKFEGTLTNNGAVLEGIWEQMGNKMPLRLERAGAKTSTNEKP